MVQLAQQITGTTKAWFCDPMSKRFMQGIHQHLTLEQRIPETHQNITEKKLYIFFENNRIVESQDRTGLPPPR